VYVDGVLKGTVNLCSSTVKERQVVFRWGWPLPVSSHTIKVVLTGAGSGGAKTLALDGLVALGGNQGRASGAVAPDALAQGW